MKTEIYKLLIERGIKPSVQRLAVLSYLLQTKAHPHADDIYLSLLPSMPTLSRTTVYSTLKLFAEKGVILSLNHDDKGVRYDGCTVPHAHFLCNVCNNLYDFPVENIEHKGLPKSFEIQEVQLMYKGLCEDCINKQK